MIDEISKMEDPMRLGLSSLRAVGQLLSSPLDKKMDLCEIDRDDLTNLLFIIENQISEAHKQYEVLSKKHWVFCKKYLDIHPMAIQDAFYKSLECEDFAAVIILPWQQKSRAVKP